MFKDQSVVCNIMIYKIFGLYPEFLAHSCQNSMNFLNVESFVSEVTFGPHPRIRAGRQENQPCD